VPAEKVASLSGKYPGFRDGMALAEARRMPPPVYAPVR